MILNYRKIISSSWAFTQQNKPLNIWFSFIPSIFTTLVGIGYVVYQFFAFKSSPLFAGNHSDNFLKQVIVTSFEFIQKEFNVGIILISIGLIIVILYLLLPTLSQGGLIQLTARKQNKQDVRLLDGIYFGLTSFLPLFEYHLLIRAFSMIGVFTELSFILRNLGLAWFKTLSWIFILFGAIGLILSTLFIYTEYYIIIDKEKVFTSMVKSSKLVLRHWQETILILIIMAIISLQIIFRLAMVILIPIIVTFSTAYLASFTLLKSIGFGIGIGLGLIALLFAAYLGGTINVFATSVWVKTFLQLSGKEETSAREENAHMLKETDQSARLGQPTE